MDAPHDRTAILLDQHPLWLEALERVLTAVGVATVAKLTRPSEAVMAVAEHRPQLLVLDPQTHDGDLDGLGCLREARKHIPDLKALVLSSVQAADQIRAAFEAGAAGYVVKTAHVTDLAAAVRQAFEHSVYLATPAGPVLTPQPATGEQRVLTRREREILTLAAEGYSNAQLARKLWVTEQTVKFHLSNIYRKLDVANRTEAGRWAQLNGLLPSTMERERLATAG